jgi:hypothetical protein
VFGIYEVVARVDTSVGLYRQRASADLGEDAQRRLHTQPLTEGTLEKEDKDTTDIVSVPNIEDTVQEAPVILWNYRPVRCDRPAFAGKASFVPIIGIDTPAIKVVGLSLKIFGSTSGMNCILVEPTESLRKRYTSPGNLR